MKKPIIGISGSILKDKDFEHHRRSYVNEDYIDAVIIGGGIPLIIPMNQDEEVIKSQISLVDGLILTGGQDVDPLLYGQEPKQKLGEILRERDAFDYKLLDFAVEKDIPVLGICRGLQLMNVYFGGTLHQDLSYSDLIDIKHDQVSNPKQLSHHIDIIKQTKLSKILGIEKGLVNSFHHQIIDDLAPNFIKSARSSDWVIEAIENPDHKFMMAVQWHPEMLCKTDYNFNKIFEELINSSIS